MVHMEKAIILLVLVGAAFAESNADADADPFLYGGYRTYSNYGFPYRGRYYSPRQYIQRPPINYGFARPAAVYSGLVKQPAVPTVPVVPEPEPKALPPHLKAVPAVPDQYLDDVVVVSKQEAAVPQPVAPVPAVLPKAVPAVIPKAVPAVIPKAVPAVISKAVPVAIPKAVPAAIPGQVHATQYHAQDEFGRVSYGYANPNSVKDERRDEFGNVMGAYSYVDGTGYPKHVAYVADGLGFRVTSSNILPM